jgi:hypothetical protein
MIKLISESKYKRAIETVKTYEKQEEERKAIGPDTLFDKCTFIDEKLAKAISRKYSFSGGDTLKKITNELTIKKLRNFKFISNKKIFKFVEDCQDLGITIKIK